MALYPCTRCSVSCFLAGDKSSLLSRLTLITYLDYAPGEMIFEQGERVSGLYVLCRGRVKEGWHTARLRQRYLLRYLTPGEVLAAAEVFTQKIWHMTYAMSLEESRLLFLDREECSLLLEEPSLGSSLLHQLAREVIWTKQQIMLRSYGLLERIAWLLLALAIPEFEADLPPGPRLRLTNAELAEMAGCSPISVSRVLNRLCREGILAREKGRILVLDPERLQRLAGNLSREQIVHNPGPTPYG